jgi:hypothetical protein
MRKHSRRQKEQEPTTEERRAAWRDRSAARRERSRQRKLAAVGTDTTRLERIWR